MIVSGGVYGSPQLLLLSGIGPGAHLNEMGIEVVHDLPPVGANLHDHFNSYVAWRSTKTVTLNELASLAARESLRPASRYVVGRDGPLASHRHAWPASCPRHGPPLRSARPADQYLTLWSIETRDRNGMHPHKWPGFIDVAGSLAARRGAGG